MDDYLQQLQNEREKRSSWGRLVKSRVKAVLKYGGNRILDAGCSSGAYVKFLCKRGYDAYGCDMLQDERWQGDYSSRFQLADIRNLPYRTGCFDMIIAFDILEHLEDVDTAVTELHRVTEKNILISVPDCSEPEEISRAGFAYHHRVDATHRQLFTEISIREKLEQLGFSVDFIEHINAVYPQILLLSSWHIPLRVSIPVGRFINKIPFQKKFFMTLLVAASRIQDLQQ